MMMPITPPGELVRCERCGWLGPVAQAVAKVDATVVCPRCGALVYRVMPGGYKTKGMKMADEVGGIQCRWVTPKIEQIIENWREIAEKDIVVRSDLAPVCEEPSYTFGPNVHKRMYPKAFPICECGGDKAGTPHSEWCPKR